MPAAGRGYREFYLIIKNFWRDTQLKRVILSAVMAVVIMLPAFSSAGEKIVDGIVAVVNGEIITMYELRQRMQPVLSQFKGRDMTAVEEEQVSNVRKQLLDRMINDLILDQEAERRGVSVSAEDVNNEVKSIMENSNISKEEFEKQLKLQKMTLEEFKEKIKSKIRKHRLLNYKVKNKVVVTEEEMMRYWNSTSSDTGSAQPRKLHLKLILFPQGVDASEVRSEIESGNVTFEKAADKYTQGPGGGQGGDLGVLALKDLALTWQEALEGLKPGDVSEVFAVQDMDAILKLDSYVEEKKASYEDVKDKIYDKLYGEKQDAVFGDYIKKLRESAVIEIK